MTRGSDRSLLISKRNALPNRKIGIGGAFFQSLSRQAAHRPRPSRSQSGQSGAAHSAQGTAQRVSMRFPQPAHSIKAI